MTEFTEHLVAFAATHAALAYAIVFLAALCEAVPVLGSIVPGSTIILWLSALSADGTLGIAPIVAAAIAGAALGDGGAYWIGHRRQRAILLAWPMGRYPRLVAESERFFDRYGRLAVFFGRFVAPIRAFVPVTAGALGMPPRTFFPINLAAVTFWALAHTLPGMLAGSLLETYGMKLKHYALPLVAGLVAIGLIALAVSYWRNRTASKAADAPSASPS